MQMHYSSTLNSVLTWPEAGVVALDVVTNHAIGERTHKRPLVLVFGSFTCPPFRRQVGDVVQIYNDYKERADFLTVYVREAHPTDEWQMKSNLKDKDDVCYAQPKTLEQRVIIANDFIKRFKFPLPFGIDDMSNAADNAYSPWPEPIYIIDESGRIAYRGGMGPFNYKPEETPEGLAARYAPLKHQPPKSTPDLTPASASGAVAPAPRAPSTAAPAAPAK